jgi:hypothetical protein
MRCRLSWLTNSALVCEPKCGGKGGVAGSQPMSTAAHRIPYKSLEQWRSDSMFNLWVWGSAIFVAADFWLTLCIFHSSQQSGGGEGRGGSEGQMSPVRYLPGVGGGSRAR